MLITGDLGEARLRGYMETLIPAHFFPLKISLFIYFKITATALAGVTQWVECQTVKQRVSGSIPSQGTCLGFRPGPRWGALDWQSLVDVSLPLFLPPFPSLKINK